MKKLTKYFAIYRIGPHFYYTQMLQKTLPTARHIGFYNQIVFRFQIGFYNRTHKKSLKKIK